jgi:hypothetical protein
MTVTGRTQLEKAATLIKASQQIYIFPTLSTDQDFLFPSLGLFYALRRLKKGASLILGTLPLSKQSLVSKPTENENKITILSPSADNIKRLRYEKEKGNLVLYFDDKGNGPKKQDVIFSGFSTQKRADLLITIGATSSEEIKHLLFQKNFLETPWLSIGGQDKKNSPLQTALPLCSSASCTKTIFHLLKKIDKDSIDQQSAAYLLRSLQFLPDFSLSDNFFQTVTSLVNHRALEYKINPCSTQSPKQLNLLKTLVSKLQFSQSANVVFANLSAKDTRFISSADLIFLFQELRKGLFSLKNFLVLWPTNDRRFRAAVYLEDKKKLSLLQSRYQGAVGINRGLFSISGKSSLLATKKIIKILS